MDRPKEAADVWRERAAPAAGNASHPAPARARDAT